jgi:hypothetical protein
MDIVGAVKDDDSALDVGFAELDKAECARVNAGGIALVVEINEDEKCANEAS